MHSKRQRYIRKLSDSKKRRWRSNISPDLQDVTRLCCIECVTRLWWIVAGYHQIVMNWSVDDSCVHDLWVRTTHLQTMNCSRMSPNCDELKCRWFLCTWFVSENYTFTNILTYVWCSSPSSDAPAHSAIQTPTRTGPPGMSSVERRCECLRAHEF